MHLKMAEPDGDPVIAAGCLERATFCATFQKRLELGQSDKSLMDDVVRLLKDEDDECIRLAKVITATNGDPGLSTEVTRAANKCGDLAKRLTMAMQLSRQRD